MYAFSLTAEQQFDPKKHVEKVLGTTGEGDVTIACWEPGQTSPYHCHPDATEIYFCFEGGGTMRTPSKTIALEPGMFVVHPRGELHEYANGAQRTLLFRVRYGGEMSGRTKEWPSNPNWKAPAGGSRIFQTEPDRLGTPVCRLKAAIPSDRGKRLLRHRSAGAPKGRDRWCRASRVH
jgi:quercetin dioxygenase-like cupin family protein